MFSDQKKMNTDKKPSQKKPHISLLLRYLAAVLIPATLLCVSVLFGLVNTYNQHTFVKKEIRGVQTIGVLHKAFIELQKIRGLTQMLSPEQGPQPSSQLSKCQILFKNYLTSPEWHKYEREFAIQPKVVEIIASVQALSSTDEGSINDGMFDQYSDLLEKLYDIIVLTADRSNLILDPELDTYYLMQIVVENVPYFSESVGKIRGFGSRIIIKKKPDTEDEKKLIGGMAIIHDQKKKLERTLSVVNQYVPEIKALIDDRHKKFENDLNVFMKACTGLYSRNSNLSPNDFFQLGTIIIDHLEKIHNISLTSLDMRLKKRLARLKLIMTLTLLFSVCSLLVTTFFSISFYQNQRRSYEEIKRLSLTDPLTSLPNRRYLDTMFHKEMLQARRDGLGIAFSLLDIDYFKKYNDAYGHQMGDLTLQRVAGVFRNSMQRGGSDLYCRFGGEEFCFLMPAASMKEAEEMAEKIRAAVEQLQIEHRDSTVNSVVTISLGITYLPKVMDETIDFLIKQSDDALYEAKAQGRNCCVAVEVPC